MSSSTSTTDRSHPIVDAVQQLEDILSEVADQPTWSLSDGETREVLPRVTRAIARAKELELRIAAQAEAAQVGDASGATSTAAWWSVETKMTRAEAQRKVRLGVSLNGDHEPVRAALAAGEMLTDQARVIVEAVDRLPADVDPETRAIAEKHLVECARDFDAKELVVLGRRVWEVVDPEAADAHEARQLAREEEKARAEASFRMGDDGHGQCHGTFRIPSLHGAMLKKLIHAFASPRHRTAVEGAGARHDRDVPTDHRMGLGFMELIEHYPADRVPHSGGVNASIVATVDIAVLQGLLEKAGHLDTGEAISPGELRRLACAAGVLPAVMDGPSHVLDLGRKQRFYSHAQRIVFGIEQGGCIAENCDRPPAWCEAHHPDPWGQGGRTGRDGELLCGRHHTLAHSPSYVMTRLPNGSVRFHRRM